MFRFLVLIGFIYAVCATPVSRSHKTRIIRGKSITIDEAPYQVSIYQVSLQRHVCGGSIIAPEWILTAAHCIDAPKEDFKIRVGSSFSNHDGTVLDVKQIKVHPKYDIDDMGVPKHDLALMQVKSAIEIDNKTKKVVELYKEGDKMDVGTEAFVTGWGDTETGLTPEKLIGLIVNLIDPKVCNKNYNDSNGIRVNQFCATHGKGDKDVCEGDSGGPLVIDGKQAGVVSWSGPGCAIPGRPGVYTEIAYYRDWVKKHTGV